MSQRRDTSKALFKHVKDADSIDSVYNIFNVWEDTVLSQGFDKVDVINMLEVTIALLEESDKVNYNALNSLDAIFDFLINSDD